MKLIKVIQGDITKQKTDAIVNAANSSLLGGGGVDGAIHRAAGSELLAECKTIGGCKTGEAVITDAYNLSCRFIIHTVGPVYKNYSQAEAHILLQNSYKNSMKIADSNSLKSISFPNISTGVYGFPKDLAAKIALEQVKESLNLSEQIREVVFVCFDTDNYNLYSKLLETNI